MNNTASPVGAFPPPPGVVPNFEHPRDAGWVLNVVGISVLGAITTLFFGIRTYVKCCLKNPFLPEDWTCALAYTLIMAYAATVGVMAHYGEGFHAWEITKEAYRDVMMWLYASSVIYCPAAFFTKVTLLLLEARVFAIHERVARGIRMFIFTIFVCYLPIQVLKTIICLPVPAFWDPRVPAYKCFNQRRIFLADMAVAVTTDLIILVLPIPLLWGLRMPLRKKLKIITMFSAGGVATIVTVYRLYLVVEFLDSTDVTADFVILDFFTALELVIGVVCACLPSTNILYEKLRKGKSRQSANLPRTANRHRIAGSKYAYWWSMTSGKQTRVSHAAFVTAEEGASPMRPEVVETEMETLPQPSVEDWNYNPRANSVDGRREGWLAAETGSSTQSSGQGIIPNWQHDEIQARKSWEAVWDRVMPVEGLPPISEDSGPPRLILRPHSSLDWDGIHPR